LFGLHLIRTGLLEAEWGGALGESADSRVAADYDVQAEFSDADARDEVERAGAFVVRIRAFLRDRGLTDEELGVG
jgi:uncharacterized protein (UPF0332 family)